jgi:hypothetical protein
MKTLNETIVEIQQAYALSPETRNALHGATAGHPWCLGKSLAQRRKEAAFALCGKVSSRFLNKIVNATS